MLRLSRNETVLISLFLVCIIALVAGDIVDDLNHGSSLLHVVNEIIIVALTAVSFAYLWIRYFSAKKENVEIKYNLAKVQSDLNKYKSETQHLLKGLSEKIDLQMTQWELTKSEKEVTLLLLKGLSTKEIASIRQTSENTIKQQCNSIYQKSNLSGRMELSAFFLEDLFIF